MYCYFRSIFVPRNCYFKFLLYFFKRLHIIIYRQSINRHIRLVLVIIKFTSAMLLWCSINIVFCLLFNIYKYIKNSLVWSSISQFIGGKSPKITKILCEITTSAFKVATAGQIASSSFPSQPGVFCTIFLFYLNDLPSAALSLILSISSL